MSGPFATQPPICAGCPAAQRGVARSFVPPTGPRTARVAILGQGPGQDEAYDRMPFVGRSGKKLTQWLAQAGLSRAEVAVGNVTWCAMTASTTTWKDLAPKVVDVAYCRAAHWGPWLASMPNLEVVVAVGVPAMAAFVPGARAGTAGTVKYIEIGAGDEAAASGNPSMRVREVQPNNPVSEWPDTVCPVVSDRSGAGADSHIGGNTHADQRGCDSAVDVQPDGTGEVGSGPPPARPDAADAPPSGGAVGGAGGCAQLPAHMAAHPRPGLPKDHAHPARVDGCGDGDAPVAARGAGRGSRRVSFVGILHPAYILRGQHAQEQFQVEYLRRVKGLLAGTYAPPTAVSEAPPGSRLDPTVDEIEAYLAHVRSAAVDIESAGPHITQVNLWGRGEWRAHGGLIIRFLVEGDPQPAWGWAGWQRVVRALAVWLADGSITKSMHNGAAFDVWVLEWMGFRVAGYDWDALLAMHIADPEARKGLEPLAVGMAGMLPWKHLAKGESEGGEGK